MDSLTRIRKFSEQLQQYLVHHKHCYLCKLSSNTIVCDACSLDTSLPHFATPGFDLLSKPSLSDHLLAPFYHHLYAVGEYKGLLVALINSLKFGNKPLAAQVLAYFFEQLVIKRLILFDDLPEVIVPVPLSKWRYVKRGYNQSRLLAQAISQVSNIPVYDCLVRNKHTKAQSALDREARLVNTMGAFTLRKDVPFSHIALIDDVVTTGATVNSACEAIVTCFPDIKISIWAMALTPAPSTSPKTSEQRRHVYRVRH